MEPAFLDSLSAAKTRVLAIHGTNYLQAILPQIVSLARKHYTECWNDLLEYSLTPGESVTPENLPLYLDRLAAAYFEILSHPELTPEG